MTQKKKKGEGEKNVMFAISLMWKHKLESKLFWRSTTIQRENQGDEGACRMD